MQAGTFLSISTTSNSKTPSVEDFADQPPQNNSVIKSTVHICKMPTLDYQQSKTQTISTEHISINQ